jgi:hypothetical protein
MPPPPTLTTKFATSGLNPSRITFTVNFSPSGPPVGARVNVVLSWDPSFADCTQVVGPAGSSLQVGSCTWTGVFIPAGVPKDFIIELQRTQIGSTNVLGTAHHPQSGQNPSDSTPLP